MQINKPELIKLLGDNLVEVKGDAVLSTYSIDTRTLQTGDVFVALLGTNDGHNHLNDAIAKGASCLIVSNDFYSKNQINFQNLIVVKNTLQALSDIAKTNGEKFKNQGGKLIGITGSVGKTSLKEMLSFVLSHDDVVSSTFGNFNNHIGLPFSLAHINEHAKFGVYELGMSAKGEISHLSNILAPQIAVITEIAEAHAEFFEANNGKSSLDLISEAKSEILDGMEKGSIIFLNKDNQYFDEIKNKADQKQVGVFSFSINNKTADVYVKSTKFQDYSMQVQACIFGENITYNIKSIAQHNAMLSALAFGISKKLGVNIADIAEKFINFNIPKGRGEISEVLFEGKNITLIDDSYNANPKSMTSAILALQNVDTSKILILGDMLELGENKIAEHIKLKESILLLKNVKEIILVGNLMENLFNNLNGNAKHFTDVQQAIEYLQKQIKNKDLIFIKGSFGSLVHKISNYLQN